MKILLIDNVRSAIEVFRLTPQEENFINDSEWPDSLEMQPWERIEKVLKDRGVDYVTDNLEYTYFTCDDCPIYESGFDEPVYVIR